MRHFLATYCNILLSCSDTALVGVCVRWKAADWPLQSLLSWQQGMWRICVWGLKGEQLGSKKPRGSEQRAAEAPVLGERLLCGAEQVSAEQLSPSLAVNTLWIIVIYPQGLISVKVIAQLPHWLSALFFPAAKTSFLPRLLCPLSTAGLCTEVVL